jgi:hypothetical protein
MATFTVMIDRSRAINEFGTYQGASVMEHRKHKKKMFLKSTVRLVLGVDNLTAIYEPIV